jgi:cytochrome P450
LVNKTFTPRAVEPLAPRVEKLADDLLERMADAGEVDLVAEFAVPIPLFVICELLGVPDQDRADFREWSEALNGTTRGEAQDAKREKAFDYLRELVARKRADPGSDLLSALSMAAADDGSRLSEEELLDTALLLLVAGHDTTVYLIANTILALLQAPEQMAALCADPTLVPAAIEETLRYDSPVNLPPQQYTAEPITLSGTTLPAGEMLLVSVLSANRDAAQFADPDRFDIHRDQNGKHIAFGHGIHYCPGAPLARMEARIAVGKLIHRFPDMRLAVRPDELTMRNSLLMHGPQKLPLRLS